MSRAIVTHPKPWTTWHFSRLIAQGFHQNPNQLQGHVKAILTGHTKRGARVPTTTARFWAFDFGVLADGDYELHIVDTNKDENDPLQFRIKSAFGAAIILFPDSDGETLNATFAAWGTSDSTGGDLTQNSDQTMVCTGGPAQSSSTAGQIEEQPSQNGTTWVVEFSIADGISLNNLYQLTILNASGTPAHRNNLNVIASPIPPP